MIEILEVEIFAGDLIFFARRWDELPRYDSLREGFCNEAQPGFKPHLNGGRRIIYPLSKLFTPVRNIFL
ncbi:hypothetical protein EBR21_11165 [bacterium]|nr:hypothetical protein [bacterium]